MNQRTISVLIPTLGREKELIDTIEALGRQTHQPDEIVVVDQNNPSYERLDSALAVAPKVRHIRSPVPGYAHNINVCLTEAKSEIVLFLDDDIIPDPRLIERHLGWYTDEALTRNLGGVAGAVDQPLGDLPPERIREFGQYHRLTGAVVANFSSQKEGDVAIAQGTNMSFIREVLVRAGGFDLRFDGTGYFTETDACLRLRALGYRIWFDPMARIKHLQAPAGGCRVTDKSIQTYHFCKNGVRLYRRHSPVFGQPLYAMRMIGYVLAKAAYNRDVKIAQRGILGLFEGWRRPMEIQSKP